MLGGLTIYGGVREFQKFMSPSDYYDDPESQEDVFGLRWLADGAKLSGNVLPFYLDKLLGAMSGPGANDPITGGVPTLNLLTDIFKLFSTEIPSNVRAGDWEGVGVDTLKVLPFGKDLNHHIFGLEDERNINKDGRKGFAEGDEIKLESIRPDSIFEPKVDVVGTTDDPKERVNPKTGEPYTALYYKSGRVQKGFSV